MIMFPHVNRRSQMKATICTCAVVAVGVLLAASPGWAAEPVPHFDSQIVPILTKAGCNAGACHGAAIGRGGFKLSLWGSNPSLDYEAIVHDVEGRRVHLTKPSDSLLLAKPTEVLEHGGGQRLEYGGSDAQLIEAWIAAGAPRGEARALAEFTVEPLRALLPAVGGAVSFRATARLEGSAAVDVTPWLVLTPADPSAVAIDPATRQATLLRRGRHLVIARYLDRIVPLEWSVPLADQPIDLAAAPRYNFIDEHVLATLEELRIAPAPQADDAAFLRRLKLDLTGRLPQPEELAAFESDERPEKRTQLIDSLLASDEFVEFWTWRIAAWLRVRSGPNDADGTAAYHAWLREQLRTDRSFLATAQALVTAEGDSHQVGPANFHRSAADARAQAEYFSETLLGVRLRCANCHNHPLDRWTQDDYHGLAAIFARLERGRFVRMGPRGDVIHPLTAEPAPPRIPGLTAAELGLLVSAVPEDPKVTPDYRPALARWLGQASNPAFGRATVNRAWKAMMGRGLVEPVDDLRDTNPATHPVLLVELAADFRKHDFNLRHTLRAIATSAAYQRGPQTATGEFDDRYYSHALHRPLEPEVLLDAIADVTGVPDPAGRAIAIVDPSKPVESLEILGRCARADTCESGQGSDGGMAAKLHLLNGPLINDRLRAKHGKLAAHLAAGASNESILVDVYRRALGRAPPADALQRWLRQAEQQDTPEARRAFLEDFCWALLNSREFITNH